MFVLLFVLKKWIRSKPHEFFDPRGHLTNPRAGDIWEKLGVTEVTVADSVLNEWKASLARREMSCTFFTVPRNELAWAIPSSLNTMWRDIMLRADACSLGGSYHVIGVLACPAMVPAFSAATISQDNYLNSAWLELGSDQESGMSQLWA